MPELVKWVNDHKYDGGLLSDEQKNLRDFYGHLMKIVGEPAFRDGIFIPLNAVNRDNSKFGRVGGETPSGHWLYAFLRYDRASGQRFLVVVNLSPKTPLNEVTIRLPDSVLKDIDLDKLTRETHLNLVDRLVDNEASATGASIAQAADAGIPMDELPALTARYYEIKVAK
jgi:hypothetical protein